jgi:hypothetical protein
MDYGAVSRGPLRRIARIAPYLTICSHWYGLKKENSYVELEVQAVGVGAAPWMRDSAPMGSLAKDLDSISPSATDVSPAVASKLHSASTQSSTTSQESHCSRVEHTVVKICLDDLAGDPLLGCHGQSSLGVHKRRNPIVQDSIPKLVPN